MVRLLLLPLALIGLLMAAVVWSGTSASKRADFTFVDRGDIITLDINQMSYLQDFRIAYSTREGLYQYKAGTLEPIPADASSVDVSPDKRVWTFHLRPEAKWTNGDPVLAKDYLFAWRRMLEEPGEYTYLFYYIKNAEAYTTAFQTSHPMAWDDVGVKAVDDRTLQVTLHDPVSFFLDLVSFCPFYPLNEKSMEPFKEKDSKTGHFSYRTEYTKPQNVVTNGCYVLKDWQFKRRLWLEKSKGYWDAEHVNLNTIEDVIDDDSLSKLLLYESGEVDWVADVSSDLSADYRAKGRKDLIITPGFGTTYLNVNCLPTVANSGAKNPFADKRVRQAIAMAIEKRQICTNITRMGETPATTYVPPGIFKGYHPIPGLPYDPQRARQLLAEAGYPNGQGFPAITMVFNNTVATYRDMCPNIKNQLKQNLNIDIDLEGLESKATRSRFKSQAYYIGPSQWIGDYGDPSTFTDKYLSNSANNDSKWNSPEFDKLCAEAARESDAEKRLELLEKAEQLINTELPVIPMYYLVNVDLCKPKVKIEFNPRMTVVFKSIEVEKKK